jgi:hypothetical protein
LVSGLAGVQPLKAGLIEESSIWFRLVLGYEYEYSRWGDASSTAGNGFNHADADTMVLVVHIRKAVRSSLPCRLWGCWRSIRAKAELLVVA